MVLFDVIFFLLTSGGLYFCTVFQEVPCCICRCSFKPIPCARQKDNLQNICRKSEHNCQVIWLQFGWMNIFNWCELQCFVYIWHKTFLSYSKFLPCSFSIGKMFRVRNIFKKILSSN